MTYKAWPNLTFEETIFCSDTSFDHRSWFHEDISYKSSLLITIGDSWTWGDSLHGIDISQGKFDDPRRLTSIYGYKLSRMLDSDFVNIGECAGNNFNMIDRLSKLLEFNYEKYSQIFVVITLTENGRELSKPCTYLENKNYSSLSEFLSNFEKLMFLSLRDIFSKFDKKCKFLIARNFTYSFEDNVKIIERYHAKKTWVDCLNEKINNPYPQEIRFLTKMVVDPLVLQLKKSKIYFQVKEELTKEFDKSLQAINWFEKSYLNYKKATKHPTEIGHEIWANYLYKELNLSL
jgi:hypothetical protein